MGNASHKMLGKELKLRGNRKKRLKVVRKIVSHLFAYGGAIFALPGGRVFSYSGAILERLRTPFIDYCGAKYACPAPLITRR